MDTGYGVIWVYGTDKNPIRALSEDGIECLRAKGKPFKLAMVATMRKLITILNAIARSGPAFQ